MSDPTLLQPAAVDLDAYAREPIHVPGAIQPHGALLVAREPELVCVQASANTDALLGLSAAELLGRGLEHALGAPGRARVEAALAAGDPALASPLPITVNGRGFDALLHRHDGALIIELELTGAGGAAGENPVRHHRRLQRALAAMRAAADLPALYPIIARTVTELTGFDRVLVYRFDADWHGEVLGESLAPGMDSYLGLHFPASDIPGQARALYAKNWLRLIPTIDYTPAGLVPAVNPLTGRPTDLTFSALRSVSPVHLEYLRNMGVGASMSISLLVDGRLWGLIACHHRAARFLPAGTRAAAELFGQMASAEIGAKQETRRLAEHVQAQTIQTRFFDVIAREENFVEALIKYTPRLLEFMGATGAAIWVNGKCHLLGQTPSWDETAALADWLRTRGLDPLLATDALGAEFPPAVNYRAVASGLLAVKLSRVEDHFVLWFRPEVVRTVTWAGNPEKPVEPGLRLHPRKSFAAWQQRLEGRSLPWGETELRGARELRLALNALVLRRTERLLKLNVELERKNTDLNSFAYIAAHDLKEPIRGIYNFSRFLREDSGEQLDEENLRKLDTITSLAMRTEDLLEALLEYSRLGRIEVRAQEVNLDKLLDETLENVGSALRERGVEVRRPRPLPAARCDPVLMREVFSNLLTNASKYNTRPDKWIEVGFLEPAGERSTPTFYVRDNGIGIREKHLDAIFTVFRRLHGREQFGGGTGAGLAIVRSLVERHGGRVWAASVFGEGTTFYFTLG